LKDTGLQGGL